MKRYDLMQDTNCRGSFLLAKTSIPELRRSARAGRNPHILTLSPPLNRSPHWASAHLGYTIAKYGMSLTTIGLAEELKTDGVIVHSLWPRTTIATAAIIDMDGGPALAARASTPDIMADAAHLISPVTPHSHRQFLIDEVLTTARIADLNGCRYAQGDDDLQLDIFL